MRAPFLSPSSSRFSGSLAFLALGGAACFDDATGAGGSATTSTETTSATASSARSSSVATTKTSSASAASGSTGSDGTGGGMPTEPAVIRLDPDAFTVPAGATVSVQWAAAHATSCALESTTGAAGSGTSGTLDVTVDDVVRVIARCEPFGPGSTAAVTLAPECTGEAAFDDLTLNGDVATVDGNVVEIPDGACITVAGQLYVLDAAPALITRVRRIDGPLFMFHAGVNGLDFVALEHAGAIQPDYGNGVFGPFAGLDTPYFAFPVLESVDTAFPWRFGRWDLRALSALPLWDTGIEALDPPSTPFASVRLEGSTASAAARVLGPGPGVTGDVVVRDNPALSHADAEAHVAALGPVLGQVTVCGNLDDAPCP